MNPERGGKGVRTLFGKTGYWLARRNLLQAWYACLATITFTLSDNYPRDVTFKTFFLAQQPFTLVLRAVGTKRMSLFNPIYGDL